MALACLPHVHLWSLAAALPLLPPPLLPLLLLLHAKEQDSLPTQHCLTKAVKVSSDLHVPILMPVAHVPVKVP